MYYNNIRAFSNVSVLINPPSYFAENIVIAYNKLVSIEQALVDLGLPSPANHNVPGKISALANLVVGDDVLRDLAVIYAAELEMALEKINRFDYNTPVIAIVKRHSYPYLRYASETDCHLNDVTNLRALCDDIVGLLKEVVINLRRAGNSVNVSFV